MPCPTKLDVKGLRVGVILSGGNVDLGPFFDQLATKWLGKEAEPFDQLAAKWLESGAESAADDPGAV